MIVSFADKETAALWNDKRTRFPAELEDRAANKLAMLHAAASLARASRPAQQPAGTPQR